MPLSLTAAALVFLGFSGSFVTADPCDIGHALYSPPRFRVYLPPGYRLERRQGVDTTVWRVWKAGGLDISYDANDLPRDGEPATTMKPVSAWNRHCFWDTDSDKEISRETDVVCQRSRVDERHKQPTQVRASFPDGADFFAVVRSREEVDEFLSIVLTYAPGPADRNLFPDSPEVQRAIRSRRQIQKCGRRLMAGAIAWNAPGVIRALARAGVDVNAVNEVNRPFLYEADDEGSDDAIKALFDGGARPVAVVNGEPLPPIWIAGRPPARFNLFLDRGLDPDIADRQGWTLLMGASRGCQATNATTLIARRVPLDAQNSDGDTALSVAVDSECPDVVSVLVRAGARRDLTNRSGFTPLETANHRVASVQKVLTMNRGTPSIATSVEAQNEVRSEIARLEQMLRNDLVIVAILKGG